MPAAAAEQQLIAESDEQNIPALLSLQPETDPPPMTHEQSPLLPPQQKTSTCRTWRHFLGPAAPRLLIPFVLSASLAVSGLIRLSLVEKLNNHPYSVVFYLLLALKSTHNWVCHYHSFTDTGYSSTAAYVSLSCHST